MPGWKTSIVSPRPTREDARWPEQMYGRWVELDEFGCFVRLQKDKAYGRNDSRYLVCYLETVPVAVEGSREEEKQVVREAGSEFVALVNSIFGTRFLPKKEGDS